VTELIVVRRVWEYHPHIQMTTFVLFAIVALLQAAPVQGPPPAGLAEDVKRIASSASNEERFDAVTAMLKARNLPFTVETFTIDKPVGREPRTEGRNIVVTLGAGTEDVVIGAHYDAVRLHDGSLSKGAVDNAASSVVLVRLAEALRTDKFAVRVRIVWFDMEEIGLIGSARYVQAHASDTIAAMLNFDINAYGDTVLFGPSDRPDSAVLRRTLVQTCAAEDASCIGFPQMPPGDDRSFVKAGVPTVSLAILPAIEAHQLWLMMNAGGPSGLAQGTTPAIFRTIHTAEDTPEKINEGQMAKMFRFALALTRRVAVR
jgi:Zn-dependent M28 family amino/carboxypeptidase